MTKDEVIDLLKQNATVTHLTGMSRFGIDTFTAMGIPVPKLCALARQIKKDHALALQL